MRRARLTAGILCMRDSTAVTGIGGIACGRLPLCEGSAEASTAQIQRGMSGLRGYDHDSPVSETSSESADVLSDQGDQLGMGGVPDHGFVGEELGKGSAIHPTASGASLGVCRGTGGAATSRQNGNAKYPTHGVCRHVDHDDEYERPQRGHASPEEDEEKLKRMSDAVRTLLECVGEDVERPGLKETPLRMARALLYCTKGYAQTLESVVGGAVFQEDHSEMVVVKDINIFSMCEHHMVPFIGKVHIGYIPRSKVLGLSKLARIAEMYARRLQIQERLTKQIAQAIHDAVQPLGVAVVVEATHMCMVMRGVEKPGSSTITSSVMGCFQTNAATRSEFFSLINSRGR